MTKIYIEDFGLAAGYISQLVKHRYMSETDYSQVSSLIPILRINKASVSDIHSAFTHENQIIRIAINCIYAFAIVGISQSFGY